MSQSTTHFTLTRAKIASALGKLAPKSRKQNSKSSAPKTTFKWAEAEVDATSISGHPVTSNLKIFNAQRSNKVPLREPAGFPVNQNFSQRVIYEFADGEAAEAIFLTPYLRPSHFLPAMALSLEETKVDPLKGSTSTPRDETSSFRLDPTTRGFPTWRNFNKQVEVEDKKLCPVEDMILNSHSSLPNVKFSSLDSPTRGEPIQVEPRAPHTPYKSLDDAPTLITPGLSYSASTPSSAGNISTPGDSNPKGSNKKAYFTRSTAHSFIPFPTTSSPTPAFNREMEDNPFITDNSVTPPSSYDGRRNPGYRPLGSEMLETLDFLSHLCTRPEVLAGDGDSLLDGDSDDHGMMSGYYHAL